MPKLNAPLSAAQIKNAKPKDKLYKLFDGGGMALWVYPSGAKIWRLAYRDAGGKGQTATLGAYPQYSLVEARAWRDETKKRIAAGESVKRERNQTAYHLESVCREWFARWQADKAAKYAAQTMRNLERYIFPILGGQDVRSIKTADIVNTLRKMEARGIADTLRKTRNSLNMAFAFAVASGLTENNPAAQITSAVFERGESRNMAALRPSELPHLIDFLEQRGEFTNHSGRLKITPTTRLAIYWLLLTMTRVQEAALAEWAEIDGEYWIIPADKKKERREHIVPLSTAMKWVLEQARAMNVNGRYLFESHNYQSHINKEAPRMALKRSGLATTAHGLRSLARTYLREELHIDNDVAEKLLAHSLGTKTHTAYNLSLIHI